MNNQKINKNMVIVELLSAEEIEERLDLALEGYVKIAQQETFDANSIKKMLGEGEENVVDKLRQNIQAYQTALEADPFDYGL